MDEAELEALIAPIVKRKTAAPIDSPERKFCDRQLAGLRYKYEAAGGIIEDLDFDWGANCSPL